MGGGALASGSQQNVTSYVRSELELRLQMKSAGSDVFGANTFVFPRKSTSSQLIDYIELQMTKWGRYRFESAIHDSANAAGANASNQSYRQAKYRQSYIQAAQ